MPDPIASQNPWPSGTPTFLFTDIEGSTAMWESAPTEMAEALRLHDEILHRTISENQGFVFKTVGDAFCATFSTAPEAVEAAAQIQLRLADQRWPDRIAIRVRAAIHTGTAEVRDGDYFGPALNRVARLMSCAFGGQTLLSRAAYELVRDTLRKDRTLLDHGIHHLKDLGRPEQVFELRHPAVSRSFPPLRSLDNPVLPNNLPFQLTTFIGRDEVLLEIADSLARFRLVSLVGSGGCGKTRLALQAAADALDRFPDGVWLVEFAALQNEALLSQTIGTALGVAEIAGLPSQAVLLEHLRSRNLLLVIDNCEHLIGACARLIETILRSCPDVRVLATSREPIGIDGESLLRVPALPYPDPTTPVSIDALRQYDAVRLFIDRARMQRPDFAVTDANAPAVAEICSRLDGIPLAIELAAARIRTMSAEEIERRLDDRFRLLLGGSRTALPRQHTLRALIDWSYDLLSVEEQILLARLAVFSGGWTHEAAERVAGFEPLEEDQIADLLSSLTDKSLAQIVATSAETRYGYLETILVYARQRLADRGEEAVCIARHIACFVDRGEEFHRNIVGPNQALHLERLRPEMDNFRAALNACGSERDGVQAGFALCRYLYKYWEWRSMVREGLECCERELAKPSLEDMEVERALVLLSASRLSWCADEIARADELATSALELANGSDDVHLTAHASVNLGGLRLLQGHYESAAVLSQRAAEGFQEAGDIVSAGTAFENLAFVKLLGERDVAGALDLQLQSLHIYESHSHRVWEARAHRNLGALLLELGNLDSAVEHLEKALTLVRELDLRTQECYVLSTLGSVSLAAGDLSAARTNQSRSLEIALELQLREEATLGLQGMGDVLAASGRSLQAIRVWASVHALYEALGTPPFWFLKERLDEGIAAARAALEQEECDRAWKQGAADDLPTALSFATRAAWE